MPERYSLKTQSKWFGLLHQKEQPRLRRSGTPSLGNSHRTQWKHLMFISERVSCIHVWRRPFSVVPIHRTVHHKDESWTDSNSLSRKIQMCSCVKCTWVSGKFSLMLSIITYCLTKRKCAKLNTWWILWLIYSFINKVRSDTSFEWFLDFSYQNHLVHSQLAQDDSSHFLSWSSCTTFWVTSSHLL